MAQRPTKTASKRAAKPPTKRTKPAAERSPRVSKRLELTLVEGRFPPPLPAAVGEHAALLEMMHGIEDAFLHDAKRAPALLAKERAAIAAGTHPLPAHAAALAEHLGLDLGHTPGDKNRAILQTRAQWKLQDREFDALGAEIFARTAAWQALLAVVARDTPLRDVWRARIETVAEPFRAFLVDALTPPR